MKYLKKFEDLEDFNKLCYWKINMLYFKESLFKLANLYNRNITEKYINYFEKCLIDQDAKDVNDLYITNSNIRRNNDDPWGWVRYNFKGEQFLIDNEYTYMGEVVITPEDIEKYNIWAKSKKYNL